MPPAFRREMTDDSLPGAPVSSTNGADEHRAFVDEDGVNWLVREQPFSACDRRSGLSLIFFSEIAVRRVRDYPSDWRTLSATALERLSWRK